MRLALVLALALVPTAVSDDHRFSDRYVVEGRVLGSDALPLAGRVVALVVENEELGPACPGGHQEVTDAWGDYRFCFLHGQIRAGARMQLSAGNATTTVPLDVTFRRAYVPLRDADAPGSAPEGWNDTYRITGRVWRPAPVEVDGMRLIGVAVPDVLVNLTLAQPEGTNASQQAMSDGYGDFGFVVRSQDARNASLRVELLGREQTMLLEPTTHRTHAPLLVPLVSLPGGTPPATAAVDEPGTSTPSVSPLLVIVAALALGASVWYARRQR